MKIAKEEIFGPVLGIMSVKNADEALRIASDTDYGLHATVFTQNIDQALHMARSLPCGTVSVNGFSEGDIKTRHLVVINNLVHLRVTMEQRLLSNIFKQKQFGCKLRILKYVD